MARQISMESLEAKIEKAEQNVIRTKKAYDVATEELKKRKRQIFLRIS